MDRATTRRSRKAASTPQTDLTKRVIHRGPVKKTVEQAPIPHNGITASHSKAIDVQASVNHARPTEEDTPQGPPNHSTMMHHRAMREITRILEAPEPRNSGLMEGILTEIESYDQSANLTKPEASSLKKASDHYTTNPIPRPQETSRNAVQNPSQGSDYDSPESGYDSDIDWEAAARPSHSSEAVINKWDVWSQPENEPTKPQRNSERLVEDLSAFHAELKTWSEARAAKKIKMSP